MVVYLIGFMGSGKSTIAKRLANKIGYQFIDLDVYIEQKYMFSIAELFSKYGEDYFRTLETKSLQEINNDECVIATGGGTPCFANNMELMKSRGKTIYLELSNEALYSRLVNVKHKRPATQNLDEQGLKDFITAKMQARKPIYEQASFTINAFDVQVIEKIETFILG